MLSMTTAVEITTVKMSTWRLQQRKGMAFFYQQ